MGCSCSLFRLVLAVVLALQSLAAHGGMYRGSNPVIGPPTGGPGIPGPTTGARPGATGESWRVWWELNKDPFLRLRETVRRGAVSGSDDYYLGSGRRGGAVDALAVTEAERRGEIVPALAALLHRDRLIDVATACMVALGKVGLDGEGVKIVPVITAQLERDEQEVRETAALALGISGLPEAMPILLDLLADNGRGRRLVGNSDVSGRTRSFAAYGIGLLAGRSSDLAVKQAARDALVAQLVDKELNDRDLRVALIEALGTIAPDATRAADRRLLWQLTADLWAYYERDLGKGDQVMQAHVPVAVARLLGRGDTSEHQKAKRILLADLADKNRHLTIHQSAALSLGPLSRSPEAFAEDAEVVRALVANMRDAADLQTRYFAAIALGQIGGTVARRELLAQYEKGRKAIEKPWLALALGLWMHGAGSEGDQEREIPRALLRDLVEIANDDTQSAIAIALGLCRHKPAAVEIRNLLATREEREELAGYLCVALALLDDDTARAQIHELMVRSTRRPFLMQQAAVALGRLGDKEAAQTLANLLRESESTAVLASLASGLSYIGDRRSMPQLIEMLSDRELTRLGRAFAAAALGGIGDKDIMPWNVRLAVNMNYRANVDTLMNGRSGILDIL